MTAREDLLDEAKHLVTGDRNNQYGPPTQDFQRTADALSAYGYRRPGGAKMLAHDISIIVDCIKTSRIIWSPEKRDHWADKAGYAACGWECVVDAPKPPEREAAFGQVVYVKGEWKQHLFDKNHKLLCTVPYTPGQGHEREKDSVDR